MLLPGFIRKLLAVFRGSVAPPLILLTVLLGFWIGMMPGWSGLHTFLLVVAFVVNVHIKLFLLSLAIGKALSLAAAPLLYHTGVWVHEYLSGLLAVLSAIPVIGITDFSNFALAGALVIGPVIGAVAGLALALAVINFRRMMVKLDDKSEKFHKWYSQRWVRILDRVLIGKRTKDVKSMFVKAKYIRKAGVVLAVLVVGGFLAVAHFLQHTAVKDYATETLTRINGAEVNLETLALSVFGGSVSAEGLQMTDAQNPQQNQVVVERAAAKASVYNLLLGRLVMEEVEISGVQFDQMRQTPGRVIDPAIEEEKPFDPNWYKVTPERIAKLEKYVRDAQKVREQLRTLSKWLPERKDGPPQPTEAPHRYLDYLSLRAETLPSPKVLAKRILADKVVIPSELFGNSKILLTNLSDAPQAVGEPMTLELNSHETPAAMKVMVDHSEAGAPQISGTFEGFDLSKVQSSLGDEAGLAFQSGSASGTFTGQMTSEEVDLTINVALKDLQAVGRGNGVFGLGAQQTSEIMSVLNELSTTIRVVGPITEPRLVFDTEGLGEEFKQALVRAGKERLQKEIDSKLKDTLGDRLGDKVPESLQDTLKEPGKNIMDGLGGLLGGRRQQDESQ